jgi:hypothetical protein
LRQVRRIEAAAPVRVDPAAGTDEAAHPGISSTGRTR